MLHAKTLLQIHQTKTLENAEVVDQDCITYSIHVSNATLTFANAQTVCRRNGMQLLEGYPQ